MWRSDTKPTPANVRKRIQTAIYDLEAAAELAEKHGGMPKAITNIGYAKAWANDALAKAVAPGRSRK